MNTRILIALIGCLVVLVSLAGCGDDSSTADSSGGGSSSGELTEDSSLTRAAFIKQADPICTKGNKKKEAMLLAYGKEHNFGPQKPMQTTDIEAMFVEAIIPEIKEQAEALEEMTVPSGDKEEIEALVDAILIGVKEAEEKPGRLIDTADSPFLKANKISREYGFGVCGQN